LTTWEKLPENSFISRIKGRYRAKSGSMSPGAFRGDKFLSMVIQKKYVLKIREGE